MWKPYLSRQMPHVRNICSATCLPELIGFLQHAGTSLTHKDPALSRFSRPEFTPHFICTTSLKKTAIATDHWPLSISSVRRATLMWSADRVGLVAQFFSLSLDILFFRTPPASIIMRIRFIWNSKLAKEAPAVQAVDCPAQQHIASVKKLLVGEKKKYQSH